MKTIVIYKSEYGAAKKYAEQIANALACEALPCKDIKPGALDAYDAVVFGGGLYAGKINGLSLISKNFDKLKTKKLAVFAIGLWPVEETEYIQSLAESNFSQELRNKIKFYYFRGGMDFSKLSFIHRTMMRVMKTSLDKKPESERIVADNAVISIVNGKAGDFFDVGSIGPLVKYIKE